MWYLVTVCCSLGVWNLVCSRQKVPTTLTSSKDLGHCVCNELLWWTALHTGGHSLVLEDWSVSFVTSLGEESLKLVLAFVCAPPCIFSPGWLSLYYFAVINLSWVLWVLINHWTCGLFWGTYKSYKICYFINNHHCIASHSFVVEEFSHGFTWCGRGYLVVFI